MLHFMAFLKNLLGTKGRSDLSAIAPVGSAARMPGTGPVRRSSRADRIKAIVGKSRIEADLHCCRPLSFSPLFPDSFPVIGNT